MRPHAQPRRVLRHATGGGGMSVHWEPHTLDVIGVNHNGPSSVSLSNVSTATSSAASGAADAPSSSELLELEESDPDDFEDIEASGTGALACMLEYKDLSSRVLDLANSRTRECLKI